LTRSSRATLCQQPGSSSRPSWRAATLRSRRPMATPPCRPTSLPCRAGNATSGAASTRSSCAPFSGVRKAVKWNSPFYGIESQGWFISFHCFTKYIKVAVFRGTSLRPVPRRVQAQGSALSRHPRGRLARRNADGDLGKAVRRVARLGYLAELYERCMTKKIGAIKLTRLTPNLWPALEDLFGK
jgi:hypothetical protein